MSGRLRTAIVLAVALFLVMSAGCNRGRSDEKSAQDSGKMKVGFVYVGPVGDAGWTYAHDAARKSLEKKLSYVETSFIESVPEGSDATRVISRFAGGGFSLIFTTSFGYQDATIETASRFPKVVFEHCSGYRTAPNVGTYFGRMEEPRYLSGLIAGKMTKSKKIGFVAAHPIPEVIRGINAFTLGVREINSHAKVHVVWTQTWYDPGKEREATEGLLDTGCDVIAQHQDTPAPMQAAQERGAYGIGYNCDMRSFAPKACLTSPVWNWAPYYEKVAKAVHEGTWKSEKYYGGIKDGVVDLSPMSHLVPTEVQKIVKARRKAIIDGSFVVFKGPVKDQVGKVRIPAGTVPDVDHLLNMKYFVEGVSGKSAE
jgi:basic membrane protein A